MSLLERLCILSLFIGVLLTGCGGGKATANNTTATDPAQNPNAPRTSVEDLGLLINIPYETEDCLWKEDPAHKKITAVLRFDAQDTAKLLADVEKAKPGENVTVPTETWFPSDMVVASDVRGDDQLRGKSYAADAFYQQPYASGRLIRIEDTDYFILQLTAN